MSGADKPIHPFRDRDIDPAKYEIQNLVEEVVRRKLRELYGEGNYAAQPGQGGGGSYQGGAGYIGEHNDLDGRDADDCHPIGSITMDASLIPDADAAYDIGENATPFRWRSAFFANLANVDEIVHQALQYGNMNLSGVLGTPLQGILGQLDFVGTTPGPWTVRDIASVVAKGTYSAAAGSTVNVQNDSALMTLLDANYAGGAGTLNFNTVAHQLFHMLGYFQLNGGGYVLKHDILWSGIRRDNYCGLGTVTAGVPDGWATVVYPDNLPDTNYACVAMGPAHVSLPTTDPLVPMVNVYVDCCGGQIPWKGVAAAGGPVHFTVIDTATNMGIDAVGYPTAVFDTYAAVCAIVPIPAPFNALPGAGLDVCDFIERRHF